MLYPARELLWPRARRTNIYTKITTVHGILPQRISVWDSKKLGEKSCMSVWEHRWWLTSIKLWNYLWCCFWHLGSRGGRSTFVTTQLVLLRLLNLLHLFHLSHLLRTRLQLVLLLPLILPGSLPQAVVNTSSDHHQPEVSFCLAPFIRQLSSLFYPQSS